MAKFRLTKANARQCMRCLNDPYCFTDICRISNFLLFEMLAAQQLHTAYNTSSATQSPTTDALSTSKIRLGAILQGELLKERVGLITYVIWHHHDDHPVNIDAVCWLECDLAAVQTTEIGLDDEGGHKERGDKVQ